MVVPLVIINLKRIFPYKSSGYWGTPNRAVLQTLLRMCYNPTWISRSFRGTYATTRLAFPGAESIMFAFAARVRNFLQIMFKFMSSGCKEQHLFSSGAGTGLEDNPRLDNVHHALTSGNVPDVLQRP